MGAEKSGAPDVPRFEVVVDRLGSQPAPGPAPAPSDGSRRPWERCHVTLTQPGTGNVEVVGLDHPPRPLTFEATTPIYVALRSRCPADVQVRSASHGPDNSINISQAPDGHQTVVLGRESDYLVLTYQPCAQAAPGCRGPQDVHLFPVEGVS